MIFTEHAVVIEDFSPGAVLSTGWQERGLYRLHSPSLMQGPPRQSIATLVPVCALSIPQVPSHPPPSPPVVPSYLPSLSEGDDLSDAAVDSLAPSVSEGDIQDREELLQRQSTSTDFIDIGILLATPGSVSSSAFSHIQDLRGGVSSHVCHALSSPACEPQSESNEDIRSSDMSVMCFDGGG